MTPQFLSLARKHVFMCDLTHPISKHVGIIIDDETRTRTGSLMHGSCYINGNLWEGTSLIIWEEQRDLFLKSEGKNLRKQTARCTW